MLKSPACKPWVADEQFCTLILILAVAALGMNLIHELFSIEPEAPQNVPPYATPIFSLSGVYHPLVDPQ